MSVMLIYGENDYAANEFYVKTLAEFVNNNSKQSLRIFDGENATAYDVEQALSSQSLFSVGSEMVSIKRLGSNAELKDRLVELVETLPAETELVIYEPKIDKRSKLYKKLKKGGLIKEFTNLSEPSLLNWVKDQVARRGGQLEAGCAKALVDRAKGNQVRLRNEIEKLLNYDKTISLESVSLLVDKTPDDNIFDLLDCVARGDRQGALKKYQELSAAQVEGHYILVMICWQMANFIALKAGDKRSDSEVASKLGMNPYAVRRSKQSLRAISKIQLKSMTQKVIDADLRLKTTSIDADLLVKQLISTL